ncbi:hypothetical protein FIBSPDRAFT_979062 [Athelia psychrophila]|uniref:Uncharacterized protein n=1 Tax=Athelia psychrophila TaxID=1759441 RepID=A0A166DRN2_9AGAM|nr:hypothetical protein FIBSPDRAFT_979062 [Fibularhizoctonia sp. CBS 109695]
MYTPQNITSDRCTRQKRRSNSQRTHYKSSQHKEQYKPNNQTEAKPAQGKTGQRKGQHNPKTAGHKARPRNIQASVANPTYEGKTVTTIGRDERVHSTSHAELSATAVIPSKAVSVVVNQTTVRNQPPKYFQMYTAQDSRSKSTKYQTSVDQVHGYPSQPINDTTQGKYHSSLGQVQLSAVHNHGKHPASQSQAQSTVTGGLQAGVGRKISARSTQGRAGRAGRARQGRSGQGSRAGQGRAGKGRAGRAEHAEHGRAEQRRAGQAGRSTQSTEGQSSRAGNG